VDIYINYRNGVVRVESIKPAAEIIAEVDDVLLEFESRSEKNIAANLTNWVNDKVKNINVDGMDKWAVMDYMFEDNNFIKEKMKKFHIDVFRDIDEFDYLILYTPVRKIINKAFKA